MTALLCFPASSGCCPQQIWILVLLAPSFIRCRTRDNSLSGLEFPF